MKVSSESYQSVVSVTHQGYVFSFVTKPLLEDGQASGFDDILYNLLDTSAKDGSAAEGDESWTPYMALPFPETQAPAAMRVLATTVPGKDADGVANTTAVYTKNESPLRLLSVGDYLYLFRLSNQSDQTIYADRFVFDTAQKRLVPAQESRFERSELADVPASDKDSLARTSPEGKVFVAATTIIELDGPVQEGFAVTLTPSTAETGYSWWQLFVCRNGSVYQYRILSTPFAFFDLRNDDTQYDPVDPQVTTFHQIAASSSWNIRDSYLSDPAAVFYAQREEFLDVNGDSTWLLKGARVALALVSRARSSDLAGPVALVDFAVDVHGQLTRVNEELEVLGNMPKGMALAFDGRNDSVDVNYSPGNIKNSYTEAWIWTPGEEDAVEGSDVLGRCIFSFDSDGFSGVALSLDCDGKLVVTTGQSGSTDSTHWKSKRCVPKRRWAQVALYLPENSPPVLYVNNSRVSLETQSTTNLTISGNKHLVLGRSSQSETVVLPFSGLLSECKVFENLVLSGDQIDDPALALNAADPTVWLVAKDGTGSTMSHSGEGIVASFQGTITGAQWTSACAPSETSLPVIYRTQTNLDVRGGLFSQAFTTAAPTFLNASDGSLQIFYETYDSHSDDRHIGLLRLSTEVSRAQQVYYWNSQRTSTTTFDMALMFTSCLPGSEMNSSTPINFGSLIDEGKTFDKVYLYSNLPYGTGCYGLTEIWENVPADLDSFCDVINGRAVQPSLDDSPDDDGKYYSTADAGEIAHGTVVYDYVNNVSRSSSSNSSLPMSEKKLVGSPLLSAGESYASELFHVSSVNGSTDSSEAFIPDPDGCHFFLIAGADPFWLADPVPATLNCTSTDGASNSSVHVPSGDQLSIQGDFTVETWMNSTTHNTSTALGFADESVAYQIGFDSRLRPFVARRGSNGEPSLVQRAQDTVSPGVWQHLAASFKSSYGLSLKDGLYLDCGSTSDLDTPGAFSAEFWLNLKNLPAEGETQTVLSRWDQDALGDSWRISATHDGFRFETRSAGETKSTSSAISTGAPHRAGQWMHVAAVYAPGESKNMLSFSPSQENYVNVGSLGSPQDFSDCTVEMWVRPDEFGAGDQTFFELSCSSVSSPSTETYLRVGTQSSGSGVDGILYIKVGDTKYAVGGNRSPFTGNLQHLAVTISNPGAGKNIEVTPYINGVPVHTFTFDPLPNDVVPGQWTLGRNNSSDSHANETYYAGAMRDVRIWSRCLSVSELLDGMDRLVSQDDSDLLGHWKMDKPPGSRGEITNLVDRQTAVIYRHVPEDEDDEPGTVSWVQGETDAVMQLFYDGSTKMTASPGGPLADISSPLLVGRDSTQGSVSDFEGMIDDLRIWNCRRFASQLAYFRQNPLIAPRKDSRLSAAWRMDEGKGTRVADLKGRSNGQVRGASYTTSSGTGDLWVPTSFGGSFALYKDGRPLPMEEIEVLEAYDFGGLDSGADPGLSIGVPSHSPAIPGLDGENLVFRGNLAEVRIWNSLRTAQSIWETYDVPLRGDEPGLVGYWPLKDGSGAPVSDRTKYQWDGLLTGDPLEAWSYSVTPVPVGRNDLRIIDLGNDRQNQVALDVNLAFPPCVSEYYQEGRIRQALVYLETPIPGEENTTNLSAGRGSGDVELVYIGQVQYQPQIFGYIEGAPPVPSENLTVDAPSNPDKYVGTSQVDVTTVLSSGREANIGGDLGGTVKLGGEFGLDGVVEAQAEDTIFAGAAGGVNLSLFGGSNYGGDDQGSSNDGQDDGGFLGLGLGVGGYVFGGDSFGADAEVLTGKVQVGFSGDVSLGGVLEANYTGSNTKTITSKSSLVVDGGWENNVYNIPWAKVSEKYMQASRIYRPNNMAAAFVRSQSMDLYAVRSVDTGAVLHYKWKPSKGTPRDTNIIMFRLNPNYVKNGTLDGNIGFDRDIDYLENLKEHASYLKPAEAYRMQANAERQRMDKTEPSDRDFANQYIWTADGGLKADELEVEVDTKFVFGGTITLGGSLKGSMEEELEAGLGMEFGENSRLDLTASLELHIKGDMAFSSSSKINLSSSVAGEGFLAKLTKTSPTIVGDDSTYTDWVEALNSGTVPDAMAEAAGISLSAKYIVENQVDPDTGSDIPNSWLLTDILCKFNIVGDVSKNTLSLTPPSAIPGQYPVLYSADSCPGKVRDYRFSTIYQHPRKSNFDLLFGKSKKQDEPIIDPDWLNSSDPDAVAMRQASKQRNDVWRVLHRVTYVNRVPMDDSREVGTTAPATGSASYEQVGNDTLRPDDYSMASNSMMIATGLNGLDPFNPDIARMSSNVDTVLDTLGIGSGNLQRQYYHDIVMKYLEAILASGTIQTPQ